MSEQGSVPVTKSRPVLLMTAVLGGLQVVIGGTALADVLDPRIYGLIALCFAGLQVAWGIWLNGLTEPLVNVAAKLSGRAIVAGPAARQPNGTEVVVSDADSGAVVAPPPNPNRDELGQVSLLTIGVLLLVLGAVGILLTPWDVLCALAVLTGIGVVVVHWAVNRGTLRP
jgi:hypothetical protein